MVGTVCLEGGEEYPISVAHLEGAMLQRYPHLGASTEELLQNLEGMTSEETDTGTEMEEEDGLEVQEEDIQMQEATASNQEK